MSGRGEGQIMHLETVPIFLSSNPGRPQKGERGIGKSLTFSPIF